VDILISNLIGLLIGLFTSFLTWWILFHAIVPKISFAKDISKLPSDDDPSEWRYRIKFANVGRRALVDIQVLARFSIKGLTAPGNWVTFNIPLEWNGDTKAEMPRLTKKNNRVLRLFVSHTLDLKRSTLYPTNIRDKAIAVTLTLEDLFSLGTESSLIIWVFGYDEFSGSRKLFRSQDYQITDIKEGRFKQLEVVAGEPAAKVDPE
jgi:hypothetical protein